MLRRTAKIIESLLPPRNEIFMFFGMTPAQEKAYTEFLKFNKEDVFSGKNADAFSMIITLRKITIHPALLFSGETSTNDKGIAKAIASLPSGLLTQSPEEASSKMAFLKHILTRMQAANSESKRKEKLIVVSYFTTALDLAEKICESTSTGCLRLDGSVPADKRQGLIDKFNNPFGSVYVFLLAGKAGGTGLNLTAANRMVLLDPDWNPSNDLQVMARIWRDGQVLPVYIYRLVCIGTIEEKVLQRQFLKEKISDQVIDEKVSEMKFDKDELRKLFQFSPKAPCEVFHESENQIGESMEEISP
jgi:SNF2 family DNA or RNA helicase